MLFYECQVCEAAFWSDEKNLITCSEACDHELEALNEGLLLHKKKSTQAITQHTRIEQSLSVIAELIFFIVTIMLWNFQGVGSGFSIL